MDLEPEPRLTSLAHGGGCGCKLAPSVLQSLLAGMPQGMFPNLLVGTETADDAAVYRLNDELALVATTDFFMPVVDDPFEFGRIAATNALSDIYAMGGVPILALAVLGIPVGRISTERVRRILAGGASVCAEAGIPIAGGHSIDSLEPIYGLVALGTVHPDRVMRNSGARAGDVLVLTKGLGVGIFSAALKREMLAPDDYRTMLDSTTRLNAVGPALASMDGVHAMTDVTGFGLLGHALEMVRGAGDLALRIRVHEVPVLPGAAALAQAGIVTGAGARNWASYGAAVRLEGLADWQAALLCDPQTSGGLLVSVAADAADAVLARLHAAGFAQASAIGTMQAGAAEIEVIA